MRAVPERLAGKAENQMDLLLVALDSRFAAPVMTILALEGLNGFAWEAGEPVTCQGDELVMVDGARSSQHHVAGMVVPRQIGPDGVGRETVDRLRCSQDRAAEGLVRKGRLQEAVIDEIVGRILNRADLLQDDT